MSDSINLTEAQRKIRQLSEPGRIEKVTVDNALHRVAAEPMKAHLPVPSFSHSTRDGFAVNSRDLQAATKSSSVELPISGEIAAGRLDIPTLERGKALRIMTGAAIPPGCDAVIALEEAKASQGTINVGFSPEKRRHIRKKGHSLDRGKIIVRTGEELRADHLALLTTAGNQTVKVYAKPAVRVICTGTELTGSGKALQRGQVISSNRILLASLITDNHGTIQAASTIDDHTEEIVAELDAALKDRVDLVITTGGMGPGKFDLMARGFAELGITPIYKSLLVRPGRATMLGISGKTMLFALPGPPPAVRLLFNELVRPALRKTAGLKESPTPALQAKLTNEITVRNGTFTHLKGGIYHAEKEKLLVRPATKTEAINCVIILPARRKLFRKGARMLIHPVS